MSLLQALTALCLVLLLGERDPRAPQKIRELGCKYVKNPSIVYSRRKKHIFRKCTPKWSITKWNNLYYIPHRHLKTIHRDIFHNQSVGKYTTSYSLVCRSTNGIHVRTQMTKPSKWVHKREWKMTHMQAVCLKIGQM